MRSLPQFVCAVIFLLVRNSSAGDTHVSFDKEFHMPFNPNVFIESVPLSKGLDDKFRSTLLDKGFADPLRSIVLSRGFAEKLNQRKNEVIHFNPAVRNYFYNAVFGDSVGTEEFVLSQSHIEALCKALTEIENDLKKRATGASKPLPVNEMVQDALSVCKVQKGQIPSHMEFAIFLDKLVDIIKENLGLVDMTRNPVSCLHLCQALHGVASKTTGSKTLERLGKAVSPLLDHLMDKSSKYPIQRTSPNVDEEAFEKTLYGGPLIRKFLLNYDISSPMAQDFGRFCVVYDEGWFAVSPSKLDKSLLEKASKSEHLTNAERCAIAVSSDVFGAIGFILANKRHFISKWLQRRAYHFWPYPYQEILIFKHFDDKECEPNLDIQCFALKFEKGKPSELTLFFLGNANFDGDLETAIFKSQANNRRVSDATKTRSEVAKKASLFYTDWILYDVSWKQTPLPGVHLYYRKKASGNDVASGMAQKMRNVTKKDKRRKSRGLKAAKKARKRRVG